MEVCRSRVRGARPDGGPVEENLQSVFGKSLCEGEVKSMIKITTKLKFKVENSETNVTVVIGFSKGATFRMKEFR